MIASETHIYANKATAITGYLMPFPNYPAHTPIQRVNCVCVVDEIDDPVKVVIGTTKPTTGQRKFLMAGYCAQVVADIPYFKDGLSYQAGVGGLTRPMGSLF